MSYYFLDTDTCIFALKSQHPVLKKRLASLSPERLRIPAIVKAELQLGVLKSARPKEIRHIVERFLEPLKIVPFDDACTEIYAEIRHTLEAKGKRIGPNDLLIAATVLAHRGILVSHNVREFSRIPQIHLEDWSS